MTTAPDELVAAQGDQAFTAEDEAYRGTSFEDVRRVAIETSGYHAVWPGIGKANWPVYPVRLRDLLRRYLRGERAPFRQAADRTIDSRADFRWGPDGKGVRRLLHPNGVLLAGEWRIDDTAQKGYTGLFAPGSMGRVIARYSVGGGVHRGEKRSLALAGKLYASTNLNTPYVPATFITQEDFGGPGAKFINDAELRNAPDTHAWRRGFSTLLFLAVTELTLRRSDVNATFRQLHEIAELGKPAGVPTRAPEFLRFRVPESQPRIGQASDPIDFRDEVLAQIYDAGDSTQKRSLTFTIEVSDTGTTRSLRIWEVRRITNWRTIGTLTFNEAAVTRNGDFVVHFHHPAWRTDRNDPATIVRQRR